MKTIVVVDDHTLLSQAISGLVNSFEDFKVLYTSKHGQDFIDQLVFPDKIPYDLINCFCPPEGIVFDPFNGSGSTLVSAKKQSRKFIGCDVSKNYCQIAEERLKNTQIELDL